jgi:hypothetical protein
MKRAIVLAAVLAVTLSAFGALADTPAAAGKAASAKTEVKAEAASVTLKGEIVDTGCYISHGAMGEKHKSCATKCLAAGQPMALLTSDGVLYLLTQNHKNADPFNKCKEWAAATVEITGPTFERSGMKSIEVDEAKPVAAAAATTK